MNKFKIMLLSTLLIPTASFGMESMIPLSASERVALQSTSCGSWYELNQAQLLFESGTPTGLHQSAERFQDLWINHQNLIAAAYLKDVTLAPYVSPEIAEQIELFELTPLMREYVQGSKILKEMSSSSLSKSQRKRVENFQGEGGFSLYVQTKLLEKDPKKQQTLYKRAVLMGEARACEALKTLGLPLSAEWANVLSAIESDFVRKAVSSQKPNKIFNAITSTPEGKGPRNHCWKSLSAHMGRGLLTTKEFLEQIKIATVLPNEQYDLSPRFFTDYSSFLLQMAAQGSLDHQTLLATFFEKGGNGFQKNPKQAFYWYKKAAEQAQTNPDEEPLKPALREASFFNLGVVYKNGIGTEIDLLKAAIWFEKAAEIGVNDAAGELVKIIQEDPTVFSTLRKQVAATNEITHQIWTAIAESSLKIIVKRQENLPVSSEDMSRCISHESVFEILAFEAQHNKEAIALLGVCYERGIGVDKNTQMAAFDYNQYLKDPRPFELSTSQGQIYGKLGYLYMTGLEFPEGDADFEATRLFDEGVKMNDILSLRCRGFMYHEGRGGPRNEEESFRLTHLAAQGNDVDAMYNLGCKFRSGDGADQNARLAYQWLKKAEQSGHLTAKHNRIALVLQGAYKEDETSHSITQDLLQNASAGCVESLFVLGTRYLSREADLVDHNHKEILLEIPYDFARGKALLEDIINHSDNPNITALCELMLIRTELGTAFEETLETERDVSEDEASAVVVSQKASISTIVEKKTTTREKKEKKEIQRALKRKQDFIEKLSSSHATVSAATTSSSITPEPLSFLFSAEEHEVITAFLEQKGAIKWREVGPILRILENHGAPTKKTKSGERIVGLPVGWHHDHGETDQGKVDGLRKVLEEVLDSKKRKK